jgi:hypothetical protein
VTQNAFIMSVRTVNWTSLIYFFLTVNSTISNVFLQVYSFFNLRWFHKHREVCVFFHSATVSSWPGTIHFWGFITLRQTTLGRTSLDEWSARRTRRDLYLTTHNTHNRQTSISDAGFETATPESKWPQTHVLERAARWIEVYIIQNGRGKCGVELSSGFICRYKISNYWCQPIYHFAKTSPPNLFFTPYRNIRG